jgi:uncharacterized protein YlaI
MKVYCKLCDKVQPVIIDNCRDAKTNEPFQDIVCKECHLVIVAGTDIQRTWVGLTDDEVKEIVGPWGDTPIKGYTRRLFDQIEAKLREKNNA